MNHRCRARIAGLSVLCVAGMGGSFIANPASAAPSGSGTPSAPTTSCNGDKNVEIFNFNDFHGRIATGANLFTPVTATTSVARPSSPAPSMTSRPSPC